MVVVERNRAVLVDVVGRIDIGGYVGDDLDLVVGLVGETLGVSVDIDRELGITLRGHTSP